MNLIRTLATFATAGLLVACGGETETPADAGQVTPDAGQVTPDAGEPANDAGNATPDAGEPANDAGSATPDAGPGPVDAGSAMDAGASAATFTQVFAVVTRSCSCHIGGSSGGLAMPDRGTALANLVGQAARGRACQGEGDLVVPGDAEASVFYRKVANIDLCGSAMPIGGRMLSAQDLETIRSWIDGGALDD